RGGAIRTAGGVSCAIVIAYVGCGARVVPGRRGGDCSVGGHGDFTHQFAEWRGHERIANGVCAGSRRKLLFEFSEGTSALPNAACCDCLAGNPIDLFSFDRRKFSPAVHACHLCGVALLYGGQQLALCVPQQRDWPRSSAFILAVSAGPSTFYSGFRGTSLLHFHQQLTILGHGESDYPGGYSGLLRIRPSS